MKILTKNPFLVLQWRSVSQKTRGNVSMTVP
jgi:hypothetical protein